MVPSPLKQYTHDPSSSGLIAESRNFVDLSARVVLDAKGSLSVPCIDRSPSSRTLPYPICHSTPDFESESDEEATAPYAPANPHATDVRNHRSVSPISHVDQHLYDHRSHPDLDRTGGPRVRFRSRVRISAGQRRRHRRRSDGLPSDASSVSGSSSSSISAPLRTHYTGSNGWGTLGKRVSQLSSQLAPPVAARSQDSQTDVSWSGHANGHAWGVGARSSQVFLDDDVDESTYLIRAARRSPYGGHGHAHDRYQEELRWREQVVDELFGKWPARLFNRHWWWWHLEPIVCCFCYPDDE